MSTSRQLMVVRPSLCAFFSILRPLRTLASAHNHDCNEVGVVSGVSVSASIFTITAMSIDRYLAIRHPMAFRKVFNRKSTIIVSTRRQT